MKKSKKVLSLLLSALLLFGTVALGVTVASAEGGTYTVTLTASPSEGGMVTGAGTYSDGEDVTISAKAKEGYRFDHWTREDGTTFNDISFNIEIHYNLSLEAVFVEDSSNVTKYTLETPDSVIVSPNEEFTAATLKLSELNMVTGADGKTPIKLRVILGSGTLINQTDNSKTVSFHPDSIITEHPHLNQCSLDFTVAENRNFYVRIESSEWDTVSPGIYTGDMSYIVRWLYEGNHWSGDIETGTIPITFTIGQQDNDFSASLSANEVIRGDKLTWSVSTPINVTWLKFSGSDENGNAYTSYYKYSNYNKGTTEATVTDAEGERTWTIPMIFNYPGSQDIDNQTWSIEYKEFGSSEWKAVPGDAFTVKVGKNAAALVSATETHDKYELINAVYEDKEENGAQYKYFTVTVTDDVSKIRIAYVNETTGKTKTATYQTTSSNVTGIETANGVSIWTIKMKITAPAQDDAYTVQCRGTSWSEGKVAKTDEL